MPTDVLVERSFNSTSRLRAQSKREALRDVSEFGAHDRTKMPSTSAAEIGQRDTSNTQRSPSRLYKTLPLRPDRSPAADRRQRAPSSNSHRQLSETGFTGDRAGHAFASLPPPSYGYTPIGWDKQLDVPAVAEIVLMCGEQIRTRGLTLPLIFSSMALDLSSNKVIALIQAYLSKPREFYVSETKFANPHDLASVIKWALARLSRVFPVPIPATKGRKNADQQEETVLVHQRGFIELDTYASWSVQEKKAGYPLAAFSTFLESLTSSAAALLVALFSLLSSTTAYSLQNGMTASRLSRLFGILIFGAPEDETFDKTYDAYIKASNATEHLLLAYIRDMSTMEPLPTRLAEIVKGYPLMLATELWRPGKSIRGIPFTTINRFVRLYSPDLLQQAAYLELDDSQQCQEWSVCTSNSAQGPQLSDRYRKLINLKHVRSHGKDHLPSRGSGAEKFSRKADDNGVESYSSLAEEAWGTFMNEGFSMPDSTKFSFDLRESERKARAEDPRPVQWSQFEQSGFELSHEGLKNVLAFDEILQQDVKRFPEDKAELMTKIRKTNKAIPPFAYDTKPRLVNSPSLENDAAGQMVSKPYTRIDETFVEVYSDVLLGNGWSNRDELTHRDANFVVLQYKHPPGGSNISISSNPATTSSSDSHCFVIEEIVPAQYRSELEAYGRKKNRSRASIRNVTRMLKRKEQPVNADPFLDDIFRRSAKDPIKMNVRQQSSSTLALVEKSELPQNRDPNPAASSTSIDALNNTVQSTSGKLLTLMKNRASRRLRKKSARNDDGISSLVDETPPPPPPKGKIRAATRSSWDSIDFEARSVHDSEGDAVALGEDDDITKRVQNNMMKARDGGSGTWLDITVRGADVEPRRGSPSLTDRQSSRPTVKENGGVTTEISGVHPNTDRRTKAGNSNEQRIDDGRSTPVAIRASGWSREDIEVERKLSNTEAMDVKRPANVVNENERYNFSPDRKAASEVSKGLSDESTFVTEAIRPDAKPAPGYEVSSPEAMRSSIAPGAAEHLRPLPARSSSTLEERESARDARIEAAKERARQLRANLDADGLIELKMKQAQRKNAEKDVTTENVNLTPIKKAAQEFPASPSAVSTASGADTTKDDPFAKDRFSGRVASLTSKFGGVTSKSSPTRSSEGVEEGKKPTSSPKTPNAISSASKVLSALSTQSDLNGSKGIQDSRQTWTKSPSMEHSQNKDSMHTQILPVQSIDTGYSSVDTDAIYPEDAISNVSRDSAMEAHRFQQHKTITESTEKEEGKKVEAVTRTTPFSNLDNLPARAGVISGGLKPAEEANAVPSSSQHDSGIRLDSIPFEFRQRYQPGMPLSNVEEERESVLSGSNV